MKIVLWLVALAVLATGGVAGVVYSGAVDVSATAPESDAVCWLLATSREISVQRRAEWIAVPDLSGEGLIAAGASAFDDMCANCHGAPGRAPFVAGKNMSPPPPLLDRGYASGLEPAELFWVIKNGIRMTGMPAWGPTHTDGELWSLVAFLRRLPEMDAETYGRLAESSVQHHDRGKAADAEMNEHGHGDRAHSPPHGFAVARSGFALPAAMRRVSPTNRAPNPAS